jgi:MFS family permease
MSDRTATANGPSASKPKTLWRHPDFLKLWTAETVSQLGTNVTMLALPLTAILVLHASAFQVGLLTTFEFLPFILVGLPAGAWVDRLRRRRILIAGDLGRAAILGSVPLAYALGSLHMWHLYLAAFLTGICTVFFDVSYQSYLPSLVDRDQLIDGNAKLEVSRSAAQVAGPAFAGWLIELLKAPVAIAVDAASYLWSAIWIFAIRRVEPPVEVPEGGHPSIRSDIREGVRYVWRHPYLRPIAFCTANSNFWSSMAMAITLLFAVRSLGLSAGQIGTIFSIGSIAVLVGAALAHRITKRLGVGPTIIGAAIVFCVPGFLIPLASPSTAWPLLITALTLFGIGGVVYNIAQVSLRQAITPQRLQGRMNATMRFMVWGTMPIGSFLGGLFATWFNLRPALWIAAVGGFFSFVPPLLSPVRSIERIPEGEADEAPDQPSSIDEELVATLQEAEDGVLEPGHAPRA